MKAVQIKHHAHPRDQPGVSEVPAPKVADGEVLVDIYAAGLNFFDILQAQNLYQNKPPLPFILGAEFAGKIAKNSPIPKGCPYKPGDRVIGVTQGAYAEQIAAPFQALLPAPGSISLAEATGVYLTYPTSYEGLVGRANAQPGEWVLVHAAAGGVGLAACQVAKYLGCKVIGAAGSDAKRKLCQERGGADYTIDYTKDGWQKEVMKITGGRGVDVVYDPVGLLIPSLKCVAWDARLVVVGFVGGTIEKVPANLLLLKNVSVVGLHWGATRTKNPKRYHFVNDEVLRLVNAGKLKPVIYDHVYDGLENVVPGLLDLEARKTFSKAVVQIRKEEETARL